MTTAAIDRTRRWDLDALRRRLDFLVPLVALVVFQQIFFPAPMGIVLNGALVGGRIALIALGIALGVPGQPDRELRPGRPGRSARGAGRDARRGLGVELLVRPDRRPAGGRGVGRAGRRPDRAALLQRPPPGADRRHHRPVTAVGRGRPVPAPGVRRHLVRHSAAAAVRGQLGLRRRHLQRQRHLHDDRGAGVPAGAGAVPAALDHRHRHRGRRRAGRPGLHARHPRQAPAHGRMGGGVGVGLPRHVPAGGRRGPAHRRGAGARLPGAGARGRGVRPVRAVHDDHRRSHRARHRRPGHDVPGRQQRGLQRRRPVRHRARRSARHPQGNQQRPGRQRLVGDVAGDQGDPPGAARDEAPARGGVGSGRAVGGHRLVRAHAAGVVVDQPPQPGDDHRHLRHRGGVARGAHRLGRTGEPGAHGVRRRRRRRRRSPHRPSQLGPSAGRARRRAGRRRGRHRGRLPGAAPSGPDAGGEHVGVRPVRVVVPAQSHDLRLAPRPAHRPGDHPGHRAGQRDGHVLRLPRRARARSGHGGGAAAQPHRAGAHRHPREREGRPRLRRQRHALQPRRLRLVRVPGRSGRRPLRAPTDRPQRRAVPAPAQPRAVHHGGDRRPGLAAGGAARRHLRAQRRLLPAHRVAVPGHRRGAASGAAPVPERVRRRAGRPARRRPPQDRHPPRPGGAQPAGRRARRGRGGRRTSPRDRAGQGGRDRRAGRGGHRRPRRRPTPMGMATPTPARQPAPTRTARRPTPRRPTTMPRPTTPRWRCGRDPLRRDTRRPGTGSRRGAARGRRRRHRDQRPGARPHRHRGGGRGRGS